MKNLRKLIGHFFYRKRCWNRAGPTFMSDNRRKSLHVDVDSNSLQFSSVKLKWLLQYLSSSITSSLSRFYLCTAFSSSLWPVFIISRYCCFRETFICNTWSVILCTYVTILDGVFKLMLMWVFLPYKLPVLH